MCAKYMEQSSDEQDAVRSELKIYFDKWTRGIAPTLNRNEHPHSSALINECLRICPPAAFFREKRVRHTGYPEYKIPGGTLIGVCLGAAMRDPEVFGDQADKFDLSRWFESDMKTLQRMDDWLRLVFGSGMSECLGRRTAFPEMLRVLCTYNYEIIDRAEFARFSNKGVQRVTGMRVYVRRLGESKAPGLPAKNFVGPVH
ncbi:unnamed protein product, partial [Aureobasidium vineae]